MERARVFLDLETTGTNPLEDRIIEIAIVRFGLTDQSIPSRTTFGQLLNPGIPIPKQASDVHGITDEKIKNKPMFADIVSQVEFMLADADIYGYNSNKFDVPMLVNEFSRVGKYLDLSKTRLIDIQNIFKRQESRTLSYAYKFFTGKDHTDAHGALADVLATAEIFQKQKEMYADLIDFKDIDKLALYCNYDKPRVDISGHITLDTDGDYVLTFGKWKNTKLKEIPSSYLSWMVSSNFPLDTKTICKTFL